MIWLLVRVKRKQVGGIKTVTVGGEFEAYRDRKGRARKRRVQGTGERAFVPEHILRRAGFEVFLPVRHVWRKRNRFTPEKVRVAQPLLVDWMFVGWPADQNRWEDLMALDVVMGVLGTGGRPVVMKRETVAKLMRQWGGGMLSARCHQIAKQGHQFETGDEVRISMPPWEGVAAYVVDAHGPSVRVMLKLFGRDVPAEFSKFSVMPAGKARGRGDV
ncbi:transcription termination/antitermination protein NusG [Thioclava dalianensis]|nr:transcription termination/antitermination NusG family protein [Thioclava dalianensis]